MSYGLLHASATTRGRAAKRTEESPRPTPLAGPSEPAETEEEDGEGAVSSDPRAERGHEGGRETCRTAR